jgi:DivIVA domain-containing protein
MSEEGTRRISITYRKGRVSPSDVAGRSFASARRGFDPGEVRNFLELVSQELEDSHQREVELQEALADAEHRANNPTIDEATLITALGNETAKVLRTAHEVAAEIISKAEVDAQRMRQEATNRSDQIREQAEKYAEESKAQADLESAALLDKANEDALARVENARLEGESMISQSKAECMAMVKEAQEMKERVLTDLSRKRSILMDQVAKLKDTRDATAQAVWRARHEIEKMSAEMLPDNDDSYEHVGEESTEVHPQTTKHNGHLGVSLKDVESEDTEPGRGTILDGADHIVAGAGSPGGSYKNGDGMATSSGGGQMAMGLDDEDEDEMISELGQVVEGSRTQLVDEIFARLRAARPVVEVEPASVVIGNDSSVSVQAAKEVTSEPGMGTAVEPRSGKEAGPEAESDAAVEPRSGKEAGPEAESDAAVEPGLLLAYDDTVNDLSAGLAKRTKKILQDYQNELLERIRRKKGWDDSMLPTAGRYIDELEAAALTFARHAAKQGAASVYDVYEVDVIGSPSSSNNTNGAKDAGHDEIPEDALSDNRIISDDDLSLAATTGEDRHGEQIDDAKIDELLAASAELNDLASSTAKTVMEGLGGQIMESSIDMASADVDFLLDHVGAAYREWKGARIDGIAGDQIRSAYSIGQLLAGDDLGLSFRWISRNQPKGCPDCDDNALSDPVRSGEKFPTGHLHPPAHSGCCCLLFAVEK